MNALPKFPDFRPIELSDRPLLEGVFRAMQPEVSEFSFTNLYMFRHVHDYRVSDLNGNIAIIAKSYSGEPYCMPPIGGEKISESIEALFSHMTSLGAKPEMSIVPKEFLDKYVAGRYEYALDLDNCDYLYRTASLMELTGRKYHDKKNLLNRFLKSSGSVTEYRRLTPELVPEAKEMVVRWCREKCSEDVPSTFGETEATLGALDSLAGLDIIGGIVLINGHLEALALGEALNDSTAVVHVEKANSQYAGLYQYISSEFLVREFSGKEFVNREQDLGEPNLRKSKMSYNPIRMIEKYKVWPKE